MTDLKQKVKQAVCSHPSICYGPMRDICYICLKIVDEHPQGRGRTTAKGDR